MKLTIILIVATLLHVNAADNASLVNTESNSSKLKKEVRGTVRDSTGTLPGVSVTVKNRPGVGTTTDLNGKYNRL